MNHDTSPCSWALGEDDDGEPYVVNEAIADGPGTNVLRNSLWFDIVGPDYIASAP